MRFTNLTPFLFSFCHFVFNLCIIGRKSMKYYLLGIFAMGITNTGWGEWNGVGYAGDKLRLNSLLKEAHRDQAGSTQYSSPTVQLPPQIDQIEQIGLAASQGNADACVALGAFYRGIGNETEATRWFTLAATQGHPKAQLFVGYRYLYGIGASTNPILAEAWLRQAANQGEQAAQEKMQYLTSVPGEKTNSNSINVMRNSNK